MEEIKVTFYQTMLKKFFSINCYLIAIIYWEIFKRILWFWSLVTSEESQMSLRELQTCQRQLQTSLRLVTVKLQILIKDEA